MAWKRSTEIKVGTVSIAAIVILVAGLVLGRGLNLAADREVIYFLFDDAGGIRKSDPVFVNGVERGAVQSVSSESGKVLIKADIDDASDIYSDATAQIQILELTGGKKVAVDPGTSGKTLAEDDKIPGISATDIGGLMSKLDKFADQGESLILRLDSLAYSANELLADPEFTDKLKKSVDNAYEISENANSLLRDNYDRIDNSLAGLESLVNDLRSALDENEPKLSAALDELDSTLTEARVLIASVESSAAGADSLVLEVRMMVENVRTGDGFANKVLYDEEFAAQMDSILAELKTLAEQIKEHGINTNIRLGTRPKKKD